jgi:hypothetical protein
MGNLIAPELRQQCAPFCVQERRLLWTSVAVLSNLCLTWCGARERTPSKP